MMTSNARPRVLVVEDFADTRSMLRQVLELKGYRVVEAANGWEAVETARRERPRLILLDLNLPVLDGITVADILRGDEELQEVMIVAMTAYDSADSRADAADAGCNEYLAKPIDVAQLEKLLIRLLPIRDAG